MSSSSISNDSAASTSNHMSFGKKFVIGLVILCVLALICFLVYWFVFHKKENKKCKNDDIKDQCQLNSNTSTKKDAKCDRSTGAKTCDSGYCYLKDPVKVGCPSGATATCGADGSWTCKCGPTESFVQIANAPNNTNYKAVASCVDTANGPFAYKCGANEIPDGYVTNCKTMGGTPTCNADGSFSCNCKDTAGPLFVRSGGSLSGSCDAATGTWSNLKCNDNAFALTDASYTGCDNGTYHVCAAGATSPSCGCKKTITDATSGKMNTTFEAKPTDCPNNASLTCSSDASVGWQCKCGDKLATDASVTACPSGSSRICSKNEITGATSWDCMCGSGGPLSAFDERCDDGEEITCGTNAWSCSAAAAAE